jgi:hypothetical protein
MRPTADDTWRKFILPEVLLPIENQSANLACEMQVKMG